MPLVPMVPADRRPGVRVTSTRCRLGPARAGPANRDDPPPSVWPVGNLVDLDAGVQLDAEVMCHRQVVGHQGVLGERVVPSAVTAMIRARAALHAVTRDPVFLVHRDVQRRHFGARALRDLAEHVDARGASRLRRIGSRPSSWRPGRSSLPTLPIPSGSRSTASRNGFGHVAKDFPVRNDRHVEVHQRGSAESVRADHVDVTCCGRSGRCRAD